MESFPGRPRKTGTRIAPRALEPKRRRTYFADVKKMITNVYNASDSISAKPRIRAKRIASLAPGLRAMPSQAAAVALACANPQTAEAIAMENPAAMKPQDF